MVGGEGGERGGEQLETVTVDGDCPVLQGLPVDPWARRLIHRTVPCTRLQGYRTVTVRSGSRDEPVGSAFPGCCVVVVLAGKEAPNASRP